RRCLGSWLVRLATGPRHVRVLRRREEEVERVDPAVVERPAVAAAVAGAERRRARELALVLVRGLAELVGHPFALHVEAEDDETGLGQRLGGEPVALLV